jgi:hypothetical protein
MQVLDDVVVGLRRRLARIDADVDEYRVGLAITYLLFSPHPDEHGNGSGIAPRDRG